MLVRNTLQVPYTNAGETNIAAALDKAVTKMQFTIVEGEEELKAALEDSKKENRVCVFDMKVGHGTMTPGYESWWRVGVAEVAKDPKVVECWKDMQKHISEARDY